MKKDAQVRRVRARAAPGDHGRAHDGSALVSKAPHEPSVGDSILSR